MTNERQRRELATSWFATFRRPVKLGGRITAREGSRAYPGAVALSVVQKERIAHRKGENNGL